MYTMYSIYIYKYTCIRIIYNHTSLSTNAIYLLHNAHVEVVKLSIK